MRLAQRFKVNNIMPFLWKDMQILDLGCGDMWLTNFLKDRGFQVSGFSLTKPADIVGDVRTYNFKTDSYDVVLAIEMVEHVDCFKEILAMLKPKGLLILTTPTPHLDWFCLLMEKAGIFQSRGETPHKHLIYLKDVPFFQTVINKTYFSNQFGVFRKP
jgi:2-polyprenyl-3-methyl-5-hydroxy-6-metoxy-1,4-benzoquinol methylase